MSSPGIRPRNDKSVAAPRGKQGSPQALRVLSADGATRPAAPSVAMPRAKTELTELLAGDKLLCVRRPPPADLSRQQAEMAPSGPASQVADKDLVPVIEAWPRLPRGIRSAILALVREAASDGDR
jgi:hypothetical protein